MNFVIIIAIILAAHQFLNTEAKLSIVSYDVDLTYYNTIYFANPEVFIEDEGKDNEFFINVTLIKRLRRDLIGNLKIIGASMGEFVVPTGIDFSMQGCDILKEPIFGERIFHSVGIESKTDRDDCEIPLGVYGGSHINLVDEDNLPETFPANNYKMIINIHTPEDEVMFELHIYFRIQ